MPPAHVVTSREVAAVLARGRGTHYLGPYFERATAIAEAAEALSEPLARVHYWTHRWHDLGLLHVAETVRRKGRPIRRYRTVAEVFEVPPQLLPDSLLEVQMSRGNRDLLTALQAAVPEVAHRGVLRISKPAGHRNVSIDRSRPRGAKLSRDDVLQTTFSTSLTDAEAKQLRDELERLRDRWIQQADRPGRGTHLVMLAVTPVPPG